MRWEKEIPPTFSNFKGIQLWWTIFMEDPTLRCYCRLWADGGRVVNGSEPPNGCKFSNCSLTTVCVVSLSRILYSTRFSWLAVKKALVVKLAKLQKEHTDKAALLTKLLCFFNNPWTMHIVLFHAWTQVLLLVSCSYIFQYLLCFVHSRDQQTKEIENKNE